MCIVDNDYEENNMFFGGKVLAFGFVLSAFASILQANAILSTGVLNCTFANTVDSINCGPAALVSQLTQASNGIAGVGYGLSSPLIDTTADTKKPVASILTLSTTGLPTGSGVGPVPVVMGWDFTLALLSAAGNTQISDWTLTFDLRDITAGNASLFSSLPTISSGALNINNTTPVTFAGTQAFNMSSITPGHTLEQISVLTIDWARQNGNANLSVQFASNGLEFNDSDSPEPATFGLSGATLAVVVWFARRKRGNQPRV
jgi:hypothetical protein